MKKKPRVVTGEMVIARLQKLQGKRSLREFAGEISISYQYLAEILRGRRAPGEAVLRHLGLAKLPPGPPTYIRVRRKNEHA